MMFKLLVLGVSLVASPEYASTLSQQVDTEVVVMSYSGQGVDEVAEHLDEALAHGPTHIVICAGINDIAGQAPTPKVVSKLATLLARIRAASPTTKIALATISPWRAHIGCHWRATVKVNEWITSVADVDVIIDLSSMGKNGYLLEKFNAGDGLHFNWRGAREFARLTAIAVNAHR
jgi:lysophospholipase L1-like esterase